MTTTVPALIKHGKERYTVELIPGMAADTLKQQLFELTKVPVERQKLLCPGGWKGNLPDGAVLDTVRDWRSTSKLSHNHALLRFPLLDLSCCRASRLASAPKA